MGGLRCPGCDGEIKKYASEVFRTQGGEKHTTCTNCGTVLRLNIELVGTVAEAEVERVEIREESSEADTQPTPT